MSARLVVVLACDTPGCAEKWTGGDTQRTPQVRADASKHAGWRTERGPAPSFYPPVIDLCRFHA